MKRWNDHQNHGIGLHFDGRQLHGVHLLQNETGAELIAAASLSYSGVPSDPDAVARLKELLEKLEAPPGCNLYITRPFEKFYTTHLTIGAASLPQMNKMAWMAYQQEINVEESETIFDYEQVSLNEEGVTPKAVLHAFSVEKGVTEELCTLVREAGYRVAAIFPLLFAYRNLITFHPATHQPIALLILQEKELRIGVVHHGKYIFTRTFKSGLDAFLEYISQKVEQPVDAQTLIEALDPDMPDYPSPTALQIRSAFTYISDRMQLQIDRAFKFYTGRLKLPPVDRIIVSADSDLVASYLAKAMEPNYSFPVTHLSLEQVNGLDSGIHFLLKKAAPYRLATGAALAMGQPCPNLLFTHAIQQKQRRTYRIKTTLILLLSTLAIICLGTFGLQITLLTPRVIQKHTLERKAAELPSQLSKEVIEAKTLLAQRRLQELKSLSAHYALQGYYYEIATMLPPELKLEHLQLTRYPKADAKTGNGQAIGQLELQGIVTEKGLRQQAFLTKFVVELGNSAAFQNIQLAPVSLKEREAYAELGLLPFKITADLVYATTSPPTEERP
jgi:hypothetical protein